MGNILRFDLSPNQMKFKNILNKEFIELEIWAISDINPNRNNSHFTLESIENAKGNVKNKPIVGFFENNDFTTHEGKADYDSEYKKQFWNTERGERILGWVRESDPVEIVEKDGLHWLKFRCILCTTYCYRQVKKLLKDRKKKVSVEVTVHKSEIINGIEYIYDFTLNGVAILGSKNGKAVMEGIPGAHLSVLEDLDNDDAIQEQRRVLSFAYQQIDGANDGNMIADNDDSIGDKNIKKEVDQADMNTIDVNQVEETMVVDETSVVDEVAPVETDALLSTDDENKDVALSCEDNNMTCEDADSDIDEDPKDPEDDKDEDKSDDDADDKSDDDDSDDDDNDSDDEDKDEDPSAEEIPAGCEEVATENVDVVEVAPGVNVIVEDGDPVNEGDDSLSMTTEDIGVPQCEEPPVVTEDCGKPTKEAEVDVVIADDEGKEVVNVDDGCCGDGFEEKYKELEAKYAELECKLAEKDAKIAEYEAKYANYDEVCTKLYEAEAKIKDRFYSDLKLFAQGLMASEHINKEYQDDILNKCSTGHYSCEDDVKKDIAIAIYSSRPVKTKMFSTSIPVIEEVKENKEPLTREQYLKNYVSKK